MKMQLNQQRLTAERQQRAWSQSQLADASGVSLRTIQRIEKSGKASLESAKALASVFELDITDIYAYVDEEIFHHESSSKQGVVLSYMSAEAKTFSITVFILLSLVLLFMVWTAIGPKWIYALVDDVFSDKLSSSVLNVITMSVTLVFTFLIALLAGLILDTFRNQGLYHTVKSYLGSHQFSLRSIGSSIKRLIVHYVKLLAKPVVISSVIIVIAGTAIYLDMENYQKERLSRLLHQAFNDS